MKIEKNFLTKDEKLKYWDMGPWIDEPDIVCFEENGFICLIRRVIGPFEGFNKDHLFGGHLCGYIIIEKGHPWYDKRYNEIDIDVHGGITFTEKLENRLEFLDDLKIEFKNQYILGFDCAHCYDTVPSMIKISPKFFKISECNSLCPIYRDIDFVMDECKKMAQQAKEALELTNK